MRTQQKLEATMIAINTILREIYTNKSTDEYRMKGDITKSPSYKKIEEMIADLSTLRGYSKRDATDIKVMFNTLHRPAFKAMVKEYIMEANDKNTLYCSMFTIGYRLLIGELSRIYASTEATDKGIVYKPDRASRKEDAAKMIRVYNDQLEEKLDSYIRDLHKAPESASPVNESYIQMLFESAMPKDDKSKKAEDKKTVKTVKEEDDSADTATTDTTDTGSADASADTTAVDDTVQEGVLATASAGVTTAVNAVGKFIKASGTKIGIVISGIAALGSLVGAVNSFFAGINPIAHINFLFTESYEKKVAKLDAVQAMYAETKKAYEEYMKIPEAKRSKKVESKYIQNMAKYNNAMKTLSAELAHYDQRAVAEAEDTVKEVEKAIPADAPKTDGEGNAPQQDDDFQF